MSRFISDRPQKVLLDDDLPNGEYVEIRKLSFSQFVNVAPLGSEVQGPERVKKDLDFLKSVISGWNFKDDSGQDVACTPENIEQLDVITVLDLIPKITAAFSPEKKSN